MPELLKITRTGDKVTTLHLEGKLDGQTENQLLDAARLEFDAGCRFLLLDFEKLTMITSAGLRALHTIYKIYTPEEEIQAWNAEHTGENFKSLHFKITQTPSDIHYTLSISGFLQSIYVYSSLQEALDSFS